MEYYSQFAEYINILSIIWDGIKTGLLCFVIALVVLIILKKRVLVKRSCFPLKLLAGSYYFFIPVICLVLGGGYGFLASARDQIITKLPLYQSSIQMLIDQNFNIEIEVQSYTNKSLDKTIDDVVVDMQQILIAELNIVNENQTSTQKFVLSVLDSSVGKHFLKSQLKGKMASISGLDKGMVEDVFEIKLSEIFTSEVIIKIMGFYVQKIFNGMIIPLVIIWVGLLLIPLVEIIVANCYNRKYQMTHIENKINP